MDDTPTEVPIEEATEKPVDSAQDANGVGQESDGWRVSQDASADSAGENKPGWYFGKYVGLRKHKAAGRRNSLSLRYVRYDSTKLGV